MANVRQVNMSWHEFWNVPPEGYIAPRMLPNGTVRKYCVRFTKKDNREVMLEADVEAADFHEAREKAVGGKYHLIDAAAIFEKEDGK